MFTPRLALVALPLVVLVLLAQSALWVPSGDTLASANPARLNSFVETSIGDARLLNPILVADTASARITDLVFDGLLRINDELALSAALATRWQVVERVYIALADSADAQLVAAAIQQQLEKRDPSLLSGPIVIHRSQSVQRQVDAADRNSSQDTSDGGPVSVSVSVPRRLELPLSRVAPDLAQWIDDSIGDPLPIDSRRQRIDAGKLTLRDSQVDELLPNIEHNPEITFWLRDDVQFHDGHPLSANDVVFTYRAIMNSANRSPHRSNFEPVKSVTALEPHVVRVVYKRLFSPAVNIWTMGIIPEHLLGEASLRAETLQRGLSDKARLAFTLRDSQFNRNPIGSGSFRFNRWSSDELIHLKRNVHYRLGDGDGHSHNEGSAPIFHDFYVRIIPDTLTQEVEFRSGAADSYRAEPHQAARYRNDPDYRAFSTIQPGYTYIGYNQRRPPFDDVRVRKALGMAIDVNSIIRYALFDEGERVTGPFASITQWYDRSVPELGYDPQAARDLLREAGWRADVDGWLVKDGKRLEFNLITNNGNLRRKAIATIVQQAWRRIGVKCNVQVFEWAVFLKDFINSGQFDAVVLGWSLDLNPDLFQLWHSSQSGPNQLNFVGFRDPRSDQLIERIRREYDVSEQQRLAHQLHQRIAQLQPYTFLFAPRSTHILDRNIVMRTSDGQGQLDGDSDYEPVRAGGAGRLFHYMNRWQHLTHDPGF